MWGLQRNSSRTVISSIVRNDSLTEWRGLCLSALSLSETWFLSIICDEHSYGEFSSITLLLLECYDSRSMETRWYFMLGNHVMLLSAV